MDIYFTEDILTGWDGRIKMQSIPGRTNWMELLEPLPCGSGTIPKGYKWNGASNGIFEYGVVLHFPKWKHPIATCRHDWRCEHAKTPEQRKFADKAFEKDISIGGTWWERKKGYYGVRAHAIYSSIFS